MVNSSVMIERELHIKNIQARLKRHPVTGVLGARQIGKTTVARQIAGTWHGSVSTFDLEDPRDLARLGEPMLALEPLRGLIIIDEVQHAPGLFQVLRVLADRPRRLARFLVLGSASPDLLRQSSETLAGRISYYELPGLSLGETGVSAMDRLWIRGGFPRSFLARSNTQSMEWRRDFSRTFLERDVPQLGITIATHALRRFWNMLAHYHGQIWNASQFARSFGVADTTVNRYLDVLADTYMVRRLPAWSANVKKRQVKAPKIYIRDSGLLHALLDIPSKKEIEGHPNLGSSWEGFISEEIIKRISAEPEQCFFWATHTGAELDLLITSGRRRLGFEIKRTVAPKISRSMHSALEDLALTRLDVIHAGATTFPLGKKIRAVAAARLLDDLE